MRPNVAVTLKLLNTELPLTQPAMTTTIVMSRVSNGVVVSTCASNAASCAVYLQAATFPIYVVVKSTNYIASIYPMTTASQYVLSVRNFETYSITLAPKIVDAACTSTPAGTFIFSLQVVPPN
jgi:hypothetical protein